MTTPTPSPVVTSTVRTITPVVVAALVYALAKANIKIDSTTLSVIVNSAVSAVVATGYTYAVRWLETFKSSKWGRLFLIAKQPSYPPVVAPVAPNENQATPLGPQPPTDGTAGLTEIGLIVVSVLVAVAIVIIWAAAIGLPTHR